MERGIYNLAQLLDRSVLKFRHRAALIFGSKKASYGLLSSISKKLAHALYDLGVRKGDKVALWLPNCPEFVYSFFAVLRLGAVVVPINTMFKREEARFVIEDCQAKALICSVDKLSDAKNIFSRLTKLERLICVSAPGDKKTALDYNSLWEACNEFNEMIKIEESDLAEIIYTSGTTGNPKGACLTHGNLIANVSDCAKEIKFSKRDSVICILPLFHSFSSTVCMLLPLSKGAKMVIMRTVRPFKRVIRAIFKHRVTVFAGVPSIYQILSEIKMSFLKKFFVTFLNPVRLFISGAAALPLSVSCEFERRFKRPLIQGYGLTEASPVVSLNPLKGKRKADSVGKALPSVKVKVVSEQGGELSTGHIGELLVKGPNVMKGYYRMDQETKETLKDGWLHTGDLARIDEDGFIHIMGRIKEMINVRGFNVYPREIEDFLYQHPYVKEAAVIGVAHRHRGEAPIAFVAAQEQASERDLLHYLRVNLASYKVPLKIIFKDSLPKNPAGKILKRKLQEEAGSLK